MMKPGFDTWLSILRTRVATDHDNVIVIDGEERVGKSTLGLYLARRLDPEFRPQDVMYNQEDWDRVFDIDGKAATYLLDEGGDLLFSRDWNKVGNKKIVQLLMVAGQVNATFILCIPRRQWLDTYIRDHRAQWMVHVHKRGEGILQKKVDAWRTGEIHWRDAARVQWPNLWKQEPAFMAAYRARKKKNLLESHGRKPDPLGLHIKV